MATQSAVDAHLPRHSGVGLLDPCGKRKAALHFILLTLPLANPGCAVMALVYYRIFVPL